MCEAFVLSKYLSQSFVSESLIIHYNFLFNFFQEVIKTVFIIAYNRVSTYKCQNYIYNELLLPTLTTLNMNLTEKEKIQ